jgi:hypothetical protein
MAFDGKEGEQISLEEAEQMTATYRDSEHAWGTPCHFFGKDIINSILGQTGCVGIRMYHAIDQEGNKQMVLVGVSSDQTDMYNGILADRSLPCPTYCSGGGSPL